MDGVKMLVSPKRKPEYDSSKASRKVEDDEKDYAHLALDAEVVGSIYKGQDQILKHYKVGKKLGSGAFAVVRHVVSRQNKKPFAAKFISKVAPNFRVESMQREIVILKQLDHPNIMRLYAVYDEPKRTGLLLELVMGSNLMDRILKTNQLFSEKKAERLATDIMGALRYLHSMNIAHRDLKPENLMYGSDDPKSHQYDRIKICDLGLARQYESAELLKLPCGTPGYMAPELLEQRPYASKVDVWAIGVTLYQLLCGFLPFPYVQDDQTTLQNMAQNPLQFPSEFWADFTADCKDIISKMLDRDESTRLSASDCLEHPWIKYQGETSAAGVHGNHKAFLMLRRLPLFANVEPACLAEVTNRLKRKVFEPGDTILAEGEVGECMFFIESGHVQIMIDGKEVDYIHSGAFFGEVALIVKNRRTATARVPERNGLPFPASLFQLQRSDFLECADKYPILKQQLIDYAAMRLNRYLRQGPLREVSESNVAKQAVMEVLKAIGSEVSDEGKLLSCRILKRNGRPEDWRSVWRTVINVVIAVNRILRITQRQRQRAEEAVQRTSSANSVARKPSVHAEEVLETESVLNSDGYVKGEDGVWRGPSDQATPAGPSTLPVDVPDPNQIFSYKAWPYAAAPVAGSHPLHQELWSEGACESVPHALENIDESLPFTDDPVFSSKPRVSYHLDKPSLRKMSDLGSESGGSFGSTRAQSPGARSGYSSYRQGTRPSFQSSGDLSFGSSPSTQDLSEEDYEFEQSRTSEQKAGQRKRRGRLTHSGEVQFVEELQQQAKSGGRRISTLPYVAPGQHAKLHQEHAASAQPILPDPDEESFDSPHTKPSSRGTLEAGSRTQLLPVEGSEAREEITEVDAPPKPKWTSCSGVCTIS